jgi:hypothetical protein
LTISSEAARNYSAAYSIDRTNNAFAGVDLPVDLLIPLRAIGEAHMVVYTVAVSAALLKSVMCADGHFCRITAAFWPMSANMGSRDRLLMESHVLIEVGVCVRNECWIRR